MSEKEGCVDRGMLQHTARMDGGGAGIRTLGGVTPTTVFETVPFSRSGTPPQSLY